jgi:DNA-binding NtrC family response regulator
MAPVLPSSFPLKEKTLIPEHLEPILVVDDSPDTVEVIVRNLKQSGYHCKGVTNGAEAMKLLRKEKFSLVITDNKMPVIHGFDILNFLKNNFPTLPSLMITGYPCIDGAVNAIKSGAENYLPKPFTDQELLEAVEEILKKSAPAPIEEKKLPAVLSLELTRRIQQASNCEANVLITGESGTGKEIIAREIHKASARNQAVFLPINCAAISESLLESELFGVEKGAYTGAETSRAGLLESADQGTLFLDEIGDSTLSFQAKLLRVLQNREFNRVGSTEIRTTKARFICATNQNLLSLIADQKFREDLYYRLNILPVHIKPLKQRQNEIPLFIDYFAEKYSKELSKEKLMFDENCIKQLIHYDWPGNIRELENLIHQLSITAETGTITLKQLPSQFLNKVARPSSATSLQALEKSHIEAVLKSTGNNKTEAAKILGIDRKTLRKKLNS